jgi:hypothetical protein
MGAARGLVIQAAVFLAAAAGVDAAFGWYAPRHFLPVQKLARAEAAPGPALVVVGDSRAEAGMDFGALRSRLDRAGVALPLVDLGIGWNDVPGQVVVVRALREKGPPLAGLVMAVAGDGVLEPVRPVDVADLVGNPAVVVALSRPSDVFVHYPGFPLRHLDPGLRFLFARSCALETYRSLVWVRVQALQDRLVTRPGTAREAGEAGRFGRAGDMAMFEGDLLTRALERFRLARAPGGGWRLGPWFQRLRDDLRRTGTPLILVEMPMPENYRRLVTLTPEGRDVRRWLAGLVAADGGLFLDLSDPDALGLSDRDFPDHLHLSRQGAARFSEALGDHLAAFLSARAQADRPGTAVPPPH